MLTVSDKRRKPTPFGGETLSSILSCLSMADRAFIQRFGNLLPPELRTNQLRWILLSEEHKTHRLPFILPRLFQSDMTFPIYFGCISPQIYASLRNTSTIIESRKRVFKGGRGLRDLIIMF